MAFSRIKAFVKSGWAEFRDFAFKGNMLDLAIAVVIGAAFTNVVNSLVKDIINPLVSFVISFFENIRYLPDINRTWILQTVDVAKMNLISFVGSLINFMIVAFAIFLLMVKIAGAMVKKVAPPAQPSEPTTKECPFCLSIIPIKARKCAHCTADLPMAPAAA